MRPIETLLLLANTLALVALVIPRLRALRWTSFAAPITLLIAMAHVLTEGPRWQMAPAYASTLALFLIWPIGLIALPGLHVSRSLRSVGMGLSMLLLAVAIALPIVLPVFHFRKATGPYAIGTTTYHWVDMSRPELFTPDPSDHRELMAQVWYPAQNDVAAPRAPYIQDAAAVTPAMARLFQVPEFFFSHFNYVTTDAVVSAPMADDESSYPVLIFLSGLDGFRSVNTFQIEELVSQGYVVVGLDQPGAVATVRFPDGRQISGWPPDEISSLIDQSVEAQSNVPMLYGQALPEGIIPYFGIDVSFTLDQMAEVNRSDPNHVLTGHLDLDHTGAFGISLGGMNVAETCATESRLKACLIMDASIPADAIKVGLRQPTMFITRDADTMRLERQRSGGWTEHDIALTLDTMRTLYEGLPGAGYYVAIPAMFHLNFTDFPNWSPFTSYIGLTGPINGQRGFDIVNAYSVAFFDKHLKGQQSPLLDGSSAQYPEVNFETRRSKETR